MRKRNTKPADDSIEQSEVADPEEEPIEAARNYLENAPGKTQIERLTNAQRQAQSDFQDARQQVQELQSLARTSQLASEVLTGAKDQAVDEAASAVLSDEEVDEVPDEQMLDEQRPEDAAVEETDVWESDDEDADSDRGAESGRGESENSSDRREAVKNRR